MKAVNREKMLHLGGFAIDVAAMYVVRCRSWLFYVGKFDVPWRNNVQYIVAAFLGWPSPSLWIWVVCAVVFLFFICPVMFFFLSFFSLLLFLLFLLSFQCILFLSIAFSTPHRITSLIYKDKLNTMKCNFSFHFNISCYYESISLFFFRRLCGCNSIRL